MDLKLLIEQTQLESSSYIGLQIQKKANVSKGFVYQNQEIRERIEKLRDSQKGIKPKQVKDRMTDNSKDILLAAKNKKIKELEEENKNLKKELEVLRGKLYDTLQICI